MSSINPIDPTLRDSIIAAWRNPSSAAALPTELRALIPANPAGNVSPGVQTANGDQGDHFTVACYSADCFSSQCFSNVCHTADCFTGQNHCGYTTSC